MIDHAVFLLLGLANGAAYAALAMALVLTHRSAGVVNFATGSIALVTAYVYAFLRRGELLVPVPGLPSSVSVGGDPGLWVSLVASLAVAALLGLLLGVAVFRPLRSAAPLAKAVASLGVGVALTGLVFQRVGTAAVNVGAIFPTGVWTVGGVRIPADRVWFAVTVVGLALVLGAIGRWTGFGLRTRAVAVDERGAYLTGLSPDRVALANWMLSSAVAGLAGVLISPVVALVPVAYALFVVPALAAATLGRFQRVVPAVAGGLAIGMVQSELAFLRVRHDWLPDSGAPEAVPLVLLLAVLVVRGRPLPDRGRVVPTTVAAVPRLRLARGGTAAAAGTAVAVAALLLALLDGRWRAALLTSLVLAIASLSLVVVTGYAGQVSLAQLTLAGAAGFLLSPLTESWGVPFPLAPVLAALGATCLGVVIGLPALRVRGLPVAVTTLAFAVAVEHLWFRNLDLVPTEGRDVGSPSLGVDLGPGSGAAFPRLAFCLLVLAVLALVAAGIGRLRTSRLGAGMLAVRADERAAAAAGIDVVRVKVVAFAVASFVAGIAGSLYAYQLGNVTYASFDTFEGLALVATAYLAGLTSVAGGLLAGVLAAGGIVHLALQEWLGLAPDWYPVVAGVGLVVAVVHLPDGIAGTVQRRLAARGERPDDADRPEPVPARPQRQGGARAGSAPGGPLLVAEHVTVRYGGLVAVDDVSLAVAAGSVVGLIGPNGAGKTTFIDALGGFAPADGTVTLDGRPLHGLRPHRRVAAGLGRTFQGVQLWDDLTVAENVAAGTIGARQAGGAPRTRELLELLGLGPVASRLAGELPQGRRQLVSVARALATAPQALLLDEPAAGLDAAERAHLADRLRDVRDAGVAIVLVEHDVALVLELCDEVHVLDLGRTIAAGPPAAIRRDARVADLYLGAAR